MTTNLDAAGADILELLRFLEAKMRSKGWEKARAKLSIIATHGATFGLTLASGDDSYAEAFPDETEARGIKFCHGATLCDVFAEADRAIAAMLNEPCRAMAPWFDVRQMAEAAE